MSHPKAAAMSHESTQKIKAAFNSLNGGADASAEAIGAFIDKADPALKGQAGPWTTATCNLAHFFAMVRHSPAAQAFVEANFAPAPEDAKAAPIDGLEAKAAKGFTD